jgi:ornithine cyclodeaminase
MHEVPADLVKRASRVVVDARDHCMREAGELIAAQLDPERDLLELGELVGTSGVPVTERIQSAQEGDITLFKSVGLAAQASLRSLIK